MGDFDDEAQVGDDQLVGRLQVPVITVVFRERHLLLAGEQLVAIDLSDVLVNRLIGIDGCSRHDVHGASQGRPPRTGLPHGS